MKEDKTEKDKNGKKNYIVLGMSLSIPGMFGLVAYIHSHLVKNEILNANKASLLMGVFLLSYLGLVIRVLIKNKE